MQSSLGCEDSVEEREEVGVGEVSEVLEPEFCQSSTSHAFAHTRFSLRESSRILGTMKEPLKPVMTTAVRVLVDHNVTFTAHFYDYEEKGGTAVSSRELGVSEHEIVKTLVMETEAKAPLLVLMHGDCQVSTKKLARLLDVKTIAPCDPEVAARHTGYLVGGTSPFGTRKKLPVFVQETILDLEQIYINGGKRGFLLCLSTTALTRVLGATQGEFRA